MTYETQRNLTEYVDHDNENNDYGGGGGGGGDDDDYYWKPI